MISTICRVAQAVIDCLDFFKSSIATSTVVWAKDCYSICCVTNGTLVCICCLVEGKENGNLWDTESVIFLCDDWCLTSHSPGRVIRNTVGDELESSSTWNWGHGDFTFKFIFVTRELLIVMATIPVVIVLKKILGPVSWNLWTYLKHGDSFRYRHWWILYRIEHKFLIDIWKLRFRRR